MSSNKAQFISTATGEKYPVNEPRWLSNDGNLLDLQFEAEFDLEKIKNRKPNLWRYREAIPIVNNEHIISFDEGFTPLLPIDFNGKQALIKQEQNFSTGSYKDRGATVLLSLVKELGIREVIQDSSGNAGCAIAAYAAKAGINCAIYLPADTAEPKIAQMRMYGAKIMRVPGNREVTANAAFKAASHTFYASHCYNPYFYQGTKTFAYEVCEQLGWKAPDAVVVPAGNGTLLIGCFIGFNDLLKAGIISKMPKIIAIQAGNCSPLYQAYIKGENIVEPVASGPTLAEGIAIAAPVRGNQMLKMVEATKGKFFAVNEQEIKESLLYCGKKGYYIEPTSAATIAGLQKYLKESDDETVVSLFSGHGLKSTDKILKILG
ncbi:threonine synthase [Solitalea koreensis]|uniref:Threonine synthase n=1 Tax=Solitalea koreensis TaxID=543615 RepID=A0A521D2A8_9SPHI|nr:threonine synthase [Solitalea koreensis]SMO65807.1 threonine synthase [Solitalea koreensis]